MTRFVIEYRDGKFVFSDAAALAQGKSNALPDSTPHSLSPHRSSTASTTVQVQLHDEPATLDTAQDGAQVSNPLERASKLVKETAQGGAPVPEPFEETPKLVKEAVQDGAQVPKPVEEAPKLATEATGSKRDESDLWKGLIVLSLGSLSLQN